MSSNIFFKIFFFVVVLGVLVNLYYSLVGVEFGFTFSYLLDSLQSAPNIVANVSLPNITIGSDWGFLNFLRDMINTLVGVVSFSAYMVINFVQLLTYLVWLAGALFGIV